MKCKPKTGKIYWRRNVSIDGNHYIDVYINSMEHIVVAEMFTATTPRAVIYIGLFQYPCCYMQKAIENALRYRSVYDEWCRTGMLEDVYV